MIDFDRIPAPGDYPEAVADMPWALLADGFTITWDPAPDGCALTLERNGPRGQRDGYRATGTTMQAAWDKVQAQFAETLGDTPPPSRVPRIIALPAYGEHSMTPSSRRSAPEGQAGPAPGGPVPEAERLGRLHARAAVHRQIGGGSTTPYSRAEYRRLLSGFTEADSAITSLFQVPDLTGAWDDYGPEDLAADLGLAAADDLAPAEGVYRAAAAEEFLAEAARQCRLHLYFGRWRAGTWRPGDRIILVRTEDPDTRLRPGDEGTVTRWDPAARQLHVEWDTGSSLTMLPDEGDEVCLTACPAR